MTIRRIFPNTSPIQDYESFRRRAINLYREWLREVIKRKIKGENYQLLIAKYQ